MNFSKSFLKKRESLKGKILKETKPLVGLFNFDTDVKVSIIAAPNAKNCSCPSCSDLHLKEYNFNDFINEMPIPNPNCTHEYGCRCTYGIRLITGI